MDEQNMTPESDVRLLWHISQLKPYPHNDKMRVSSDEERAALKNSIIQDGLFAPLLIDNRDDHKGETLGGNHTLDILNELHTEHPEVKNYEWIWVELRKPNNDAHALELALKHNAKYARYIREGLTELVQQYKTEMNVEAINVQIDEPQRISDLLDVDVQESEVNQPEPEGDSEPEQPQEPEGSEEGGDEALTEGAEPKEERSVSWVMKFTEAGYKDILERFIAIKQEQSIESEEEVLRFLLGQYDAIQANDAAEKPVEETNS